MTTEGKEKLDSRLRGKDRRNKRKKDCHEHLRELAMTQERLYG
jgi:hypothetical protein